MQRVVKSKSLSFLSLNLISCFQGLSRRIDFSKLSICFFSCVIPHIFRHWRIFSSVCIVHAILFMSWYPRKGLTYLPIQFIRNDEFGRSRYPHCCSLTKSATYRRNKPWLSQRPVTVHIPHTSLISWAHQGKDLRKTSRWVLQPVRVVHVSWVMYCRSFEMLAHLCTSEQWLWPLVQILIGIVYWKTRFKEITSGQTVSGRTPVRTQFPVAPITLEMLGGFPFPQRL